MKTIGDLLTRDLSRKIEEIIQVDQADEQSVHAEITEYVATESIREQYYDLLKAVGICGVGHETNFTNRAQLLCTGDFTQYKKAPTFR